MTQTIYFGNPATVEIACWDPDDAKRAPAFTTYHDVFAVHYTDDGQGSSISAEMIDQQLDPDPDNQYTILQMSDGGTATYRSTWCRVVSVKHY